MTKPERAEEFSCFFFLEGNIILLHAFKKKTRELPEKEIEQAKKNMEDFILRYRQDEFEL